jgi:hypothetical protein
VRAANLTKLLLLFELFYCNVYLRASLLLRSAPPDGIVLALPYQGALQSFGSSYLGAARAYSSCHIAMSIFAPHCFCAPRPLTASFLRCHITGSFSLLFKWYRRCARLFGHIAMSIFAPHCFCAPCPLTASFLRCHITGSFSLLFKWSQRCARLKPSSLFRVLGATCATSSTPAGRGPHLSLNNTRGPSTPLGSSVEP